MIGKLLNRNEYTVFVKHNGETVAINSFHETKNDIHSENLEKSIQVLKTEKIYFIPKGE